MVRFRLVWGCACGLVVALGIAAAVLALPAVSLVPLFLVPGLLGFLTALIARMDADAQVGLDRLRRAMTTGLVVGCACVGAAGLLALLGPGALLIGALVAGTSPPVVRRFLPKADKGDELRQQPTLLLCRQWQSSYEALKIEPVASRRLEIVRARARCLDELERRDPAGLQAWLASNASAAGDPARFLSEPPSSS
ncbi:hypothetical protein F1D05_01655 [Kribbella qitaiheensis]|uniref:Uncharacterized protein n=1 Tax=Kribbella qitaiheensis TaxID=1544730 RepID=A0A7G6WS75_9ACTN|nr:hypothetical protein [Kribbella qitaiheensis]QNE16840.1 hypothetical protein F1D05_01655 [Kribbella qitaiheensis]